LQALPWLTVATETAQPGRPNVWATDGDDEDVSLLIVGHTDTVPPTPGWTKPAFTVEDGRYYALGACDAKGGIAAVVDALAAAGPTQGVGILFYADEEYTFEGMRAFLDAHPGVRPQTVLSVCGPPAKMLDGCRGIIELELEVRGVPGHASQPWLGASATEALLAIIRHLQAWVPAQPAAHRSVLNVAALHAGSRTQEQADGHGPPPTLATPNRIPDAAWALLEVRSGGEAVSATALEAEVHTSLTAFNDGREIPAMLERLTVHFALPGYASAPSAVAPFEVAFGHLHEGERCAPSAAGFIDVAMIAAERSCGAVCLGPLGGNGHAPDEWVDLESLEAYRDGVVRLLSRHTRN
jgi:acetylornithine deacetylase/succinyl-diaminopimelate desuccinylase-like protein